MLVNNSIPQNELNEKQYTVSVRKMCADTLLENFRTQYLAIMPSGHKSYNDQTPPKTPKWETVARRNGIKTWNELLKLAGLGNYRKAVKDPTRFTVRCYDQF